MKKSLKTKDIIDKEVQTERSRELVRIVIPILIRYAKQGVSTVPYDTLIKELGYTRYSGIGSVLGRVNDVFTRLEKETGEKIPTLNVLIISPKTGLPSSGFDVVYPKYNDMNNDEKRIFVDGLVKKAFEYENWDWVLSKLGLTPSEIETSESEQNIRSGSLNGTGGEGEKHKRLKKYIYNHPEEIGIKDIKNRMMEYVLLSGDRIDVFFELNNGSKVAVEIKPSSSPDADILRGLFQCVKYKTVLDAEDKIHGEKPSNSSILVVEGELSTENKKVQEVLGINVKIMSSKK